GRSRGARRGGVVAAVVLGRGGDDLDDGGDQRRRPVPVHAVPGAVVRIGVIGAGAIARRHIDVLERREGVSVAAVCDTDAARASALADRMGATAHTDWAEMLGTELDAVFVCTPPVVHAPPAIAAFQRGLAVYLEKPLARDADDGAAIVEAWRSTGAVCGVGYQWRSLDVVAELRALRGGAAPGMLVSRSFGHTESGRGDLHTESWFTDPR